MPPRREVPRLIAITSLASHPDVDSLVGAVRGAALAGLPAVLMRAHELAPEARLDLARRLRAALEGTDTLLLVNRDLEAARAGGAEGVHLGARGPTLAEARRATGDAALLGWSAHSEAEALRAFADGADYVFFSPIFETPAKDVAPAPFVAPATPGTLAPPTSSLAPPVGIVRLAALARSAPGPVLALGGIDARNAARAMEAGAAGVAVLRAILGAPDPGGATRAMLEEIGSGTATPPDARTSSPRAIPPAGSSPR